MAYGLSDSPAGQLAWIVEKFKEWTDPSAGLPENAVDRDQLLTNISIYWFTNTAGSSANLYYETFHDPSLFAPQERGTVPTGVAVFTTQDIAIRRLPNASTTSSIGANSIEVVTSRPWKRRTSSSGDLRTFFRGLR